MTAGLILLLASTVLGDPEVLARPQPAAQGDVVVLETHVPPSAAELEQEGGVAAKPVLFHASGDRYLALVGVDAEGPPGHRRLTIRWEEGASTVQLKVKAKDFPTERLRVEPKYVEPPADVIGRVVAEKARLEMLWARTGSERLWERPFRRPVAAAPSSAFGLQRVFNGQRRSPHNGVDFPVGAGVPVAAANSGVVVVAEELYFTGNTVVVDHGVGLYTTYAHLSEIRVGAGEGVSRGSVVGLVGATGRATGPHLHWGARLLAARVDPMQLLDLEGEKEHGIRGR